MKLNFFIIFFLFSLNAIAQNQDAKIENKANQIITLIEKGDKETLQKISTKKMHCSLCFVETPRNYNIKKEKFYKKYFNEIFTEDLISRIKRKENIIISERSENTDFIILYTTFRNNEFGDGHEGGQFGFWFKEKNDELLFSGVETIP